MNYIQKRIDELKEQIEKKQNFVDHNEEDMSKIQATVIRQGIVKLNEELEYWNAEIKTEHVFNTLSDWIMDEHCAMRIIKGGDPESVKDRVAFIEKSPRVRLSRYKFGLEEKRDGSGGCSSSQTDAWIYGPKGSGQEYGAYEPSREWCDKMLIALGWE